MLSVSERTCFHFDSAHQGNYEAAKKIVLILEPLFKGLTLICNSVKLNIIL